jgi:hypothetical protein
MMRLPFCLIAAALLAFMISGCSNQDSDQPSVGSISIKARSGAVIEKAKLPKSAKKTRGERST